MHQFHHMYCGLCHTLKQRHGFWAQFILNYDFTFLALLLSQQTGEETCQSRCLASPVKCKCYSVQTSALELAADQSVILAYWQLSDHVADSGFLKATVYRLVRRLLQSAYKNAAAYRPKFDSVTQEQLKQLHQLEQEHCASMDQAAHTFATILSAAAEEMEQQREQRVLGQLLYHLGRWIYLIDGADDMAKDVKSGNYNPVVLRYGLDDGTWTEQTKADFANSLDHSIRMVATAFELRPPTPWTSLIESTVYTGMFIVGHAVLEGTFQKTISRRHHFKKQIEKPKNVEEHP